MEMAQSSKTSTNITAAEKPELNRHLKRNIGELTMEIKPNEEPKSPARKEVKVAHEILLNRELEQWKQLVKDDKIRQSIIYSDTNRSQTSNNPNDILTADQHRFINDASNSEQIVEESREFRCKFEFFAHLNQTLVNLSNEKAIEALDAIKDQAYRTSIKNYEQNIQRFYPPITTSDGSIDA